MTPAAMLRGWGFSLGLGLNVWGLAWLLCH